MNAISICMLTLKWFDSHVHVYISLDYVFTFYKFINEHFDKFQSTIITQACLEIGHEFCFLTIPTIFHSESIDFHCKTPAVRESNIFIPKKQFLIPKHKQFHTLSSPVKLMISILQLSDNSSHGILLSSPKKKK